VFKIANPEYDFLQQVCVALLYNFMSTTSYDVNVAAEEAARSSAIAAGCIHHYLCRAVLPTGYEKYMLECG